MPRARMPLLLILLCASLPLTGCGTQPTGDADATAAAEKKGRDAAQGDLQKGLLKLKVEPLPDPPWWNEYTKLLKDRCGVTIEVVAKFQDPQVKAEMHGYNAVMRARIESKFGPGILGRLEAEAQGKK